MNTIRGAIVSSQIRIQSHSATTRRGRSVSWLRRLPFSSPAPGARHLCDSADKRHDTEHGNTPDHRESREQRTGRGGVGGNMGGPRVLVDIGRDHRAPMKRNAE